MTTLLTIDDTMQWVTETSNGDFSWLNKVFDGYHPIIGDMAGMETIAMFWARVISRTGSEIVDGDEAITGTTSLLCGPVTKAADESDEEGVSRFQERFISAMVGSRHDKGWKLVLLDELRMETVPKALYMLHMNMRANSTAEILSPGDGEMMVLAAAWEAESVQWVGDDGSFTHPLLLPALMYMARANTITEEDDDDQTTCG